MSNPWGKIEWQGKYHNNSGLWTEQLYKKVGFAKDSNSIFYLTLEEFSQVFESISICAYREAYQYQIQKIPLNLKTKNNGSTYFLLKLSQKQDLCLRVHQFLQILGRSIDLKYKYCSVDFLLFSSVIHQKKSVDLIEIGCKDKYYGHSSILLTDNNCGFITCLLYTSDAADEEDSVDLGVRWILNNKK
eukprot:TRINITY_DN4259_c0_g2_i1.p1 TRINITY_DN4259_c0_g2~~TRINITY_DN4259_c0_g2_i1.p1  ORF type:complete len:188 (-),score=10.22 TRINITY_DN4259_c0_g2_i1:44-607(-)